jgi:TatD DNase family protein
LQLIDTHVHINFEVFQGDLDGLQQRWREAGVAHLVHSCVEPNEFSQIQALADRFPELSFAVGLHPLDAEKWQEDTEAKIRHLASSDPRVVAIGEMGLDFYKADDRERQERAFLRQLSIAEELGKPVIIHCRDAAGRMREILGEFLDRGGKVTGVMHCWSGSPTETQWFLDLGLYISFSGIITFNNAKQLRESLQIVPDERLLIETDCPFLAPIPKRGKRNEPAYVRHVAECVAQLRQTSLDRLARQTTANACQLFNLNLESI